MWAADVPDRAAGSAQAAAAPEREEKVREVVQPQWVVVVRAVAVAGWAAVVAAWAMEEAGLSEAVAMAPVVGHWPPP